MGLWAQPLHKHRGGGFASTLWASTRKPMAGLGAVRTRLGMQSRLLGDVPATTRHLLWECKNTQEQRARTRIHPHILPNMVPDSERAALLLNGWFRAIWDPPAGVSQADW
eukprot:2104791-Pyramimonas_sp.AAC.1